MLPPPEDPAASLPVPASGAGGEGPAAEVHVGRRTWPERFAILGTFLAALVCLLVAAGLVGGYLVARQRNVVDFQNPAEAAAELAAAETTAATLAATATTTTNPPANTDETIGADPGAGPPSSGAGSPVSTADTPADPSTTAAAPTTQAGPPATFPEADSAAQNFLITGADNNACLDPDSPYAGTFGDREELGERSDTIMVLRVDPEANRVAILSFPRDLYVEIAGSGSMSRINSAYQRGQPQRLADTIFQNFDIPIDHFVQVDFCAFKTLVDAVGGVAVPFAYPARDGNTNLNVPTTGCFTFDGEHALAYVRSRHYEYEDPAGSDNWATDPSSDLGRISRQQDFLRRTLSSLLDSGPLNPRVARGLIQASTSYITTDRELTPARMLEFAGVLNDVDPASILTYQIEASGRTVGGAAVLIPNTDGDNMQAVLSIFRGEMSLADAPEQVFEQTTTAPPRGSTTTVVTSTPESTGSGIGTILPVGGSTPDGSAVESSTGSVVNGEPEQNEFGIVPPRDQTC